MGLELVMFIGIASGAFVLIVGALVCCCLRKRKKRRQRILQSAADGDTDIEDVDVPEVERRQDGGSYGQLQILSGQEPSAPEPQYSSSHFNPFASNQVRLPFGQSSQENRTLRDMLLQSRS